MTILRKKYEENNNKFQNKLSDLIASQKQQTEKNDEIQSL